MGFTSLEGEVRRRWKRVAQLALDSEELRSLRIAIALVCEAPQDPAARTRLHTLTADARTCEQLAPLLAAEARLTRDPDVVAALDDELLRTRAQIEPGPPPIETLQVAIEREPENPAHHEQLAWAYYLAGVWPRAAEVLEHLASLLPPEQAILPLHAAAKLYRNTGYTQRSLAAYRAVVVRKPSNTAALIALGELITESPQAPQPSPFDPPATEPVEWPALPTVTDPEREPAAATIEPVEPVPASPRPRKRMQILDRIDDAELEQRFASVFDEGESFGERTCEAPAASDTVPGPADEDDDEVLELSIDEPEEAAGRDTVPVLAAPDRERAGPALAPPEARPVPVDARPIAAIRLQPARATREPSERTRAREVAEPGREPTPRTGEPGDPFADPTPRQPTREPSERTRTREARDRPPATEPTREPSERTRARASSDRPYSEPTREPSERTRAREPGERLPSQEPGREPTARTARLRDPSELFAQPARDPGEPTRRMRGVSDRPPFVQATRATSAPSDRARAREPSDPPFAQVAEELSERTVRRREPSDRPPLARVTPSKQIIELDETRQSKEIIAVDELLDADFLATDELPGVTEPFVRGATPAPKPRRAIEDVPDTATASRESKQIISLEDLPVRTEARTGRVVAAEQRLRAVLTERPLETQVHLSLVDLLRENARLDDADHHLRDALFEAPVRATAHRAALLHRHALVTAARGDRDAAHAMLRTAHQLDPMNLIVELALGESYFAREAWTDAALHLGALATHRDAASHARPVAASLVSAAQAELRLRRPANAVRHYQAALRLDPSCEPARRALALKPR